MNKKNTKRALLTSVLSLAVCGSMLVGTTFAWFTDSVSSVNNVITTGNLDVEVEYTLDGEKWADLDNASNLFQAGLWEPGHTEVVGLKISNAGSLALKYKVDLDVVEEKEGTNVDGDAFKLSEILQAGTVYNQAVENGEASAIGDWVLANSFNSRERMQNVATVALKDYIVQGDTMLFEGDAHYVIIAITMPETVGNEANYKKAGEGEEADKYQPKIDFKLNVVATQATYESDSFGNDYDAEAKYPIVIPADAKPVASLDELKTTLAEGGDIRIVAPITVNEVLTVSADTALWDYGVNTLTFEGTGTKITVNANTALALNGVDVDAKGEYSFDADGNIVYDADARRTTPLLNIGAGSALTLDCGTNIENVVAKGSAVIYAKGADDNRATVTIKEATIQNCAGESGTIINVDKASDVYIEDGAVISNNASYNNNNHGIIRVYNAWDAANPSTVTMNGGEISGNYYSGNGMIGLYYGKMTMNGGKLCNNAWFEDNKKHNGFYPVVYVHSNSQFIMNGGEISGNRVRFGALNCLNSAIEPAIIINGGTVTNNINTDNNTDAFAAVVLEEEGKLYKSISVSSEANVSGTVWDYYTGYYALEEYLAKLN